jgi:hypothetical protein
MNGKNTQNSKTDDYLTDILTISCSIGKVPHKKEYEKMGNFSPSYGINNFGSWPNTVSAMGSKVFDMNPSMNLYSYYLEQMIENNNVVYYNKDKDLKSDFKEYLEQKTPLDLTINAYYWTGIKYDSEYVNISGTIGTRDKDQILDYIKEYHEKFHTTGDGRNHFDKICDIYKTNITELLYFFSCYTDALREAKIIPKYEFKGRAEPKKIDEFIQRGTEYLENNPSKEADYTTRNVLDKVTENLPDT